MELDARVTAAGKAEGIHFAFDKVERTPNTADAHRLIWIAEQHGCQEAVVEGLFQAYFTEGKDIGDRETLIGLAAESGIDRQIAETMLSSEAGMEVIAQAAELSRRHAVTGVPFFIINEAITLSGAQASETFIDAFNMSSNDAGPKKLLFVCSKNKWRSLTAERIFHGVDGYDVRSAGTEKDARIKVTAGHVGWADMIFVMEKKHRRRLEEKFGDIVDGKEVVCLNIPDDYELMDPELIDVLLEKLSLYITIPE